MPPLLAELFSDRKPSFEDRIYLSDNFASLEISDKNSHSLWDGVERNTTKHTKSI